MPAVHRDLDVVTGGGLPALGQQTGIRADRGNLAVGRGGELACQGFFLGLPLF